MVKKPDYSNLADDNVKELSDTVTREALYRVTEQLKLILQNIDERLTGGGL